MFLILTGIVKFVVGAFLAGCVWFTYTMFRDARRNMEREVQELKEQLSTTE